MSLTGPDSRLISVRPALWRFDCATPCSEGFIVLRDWELCSSVSLGHELWSTLGTDHVLCDVVVYRMATLAICRNDPSAF